MKQDNVRIIDLRATTNFVFKGVANKYCIDFLESFDQIPVLIGHVRPFWDVINWLVYMALYFCGKVPLFEGRVVASGCCINKSEPAEAEAT